MPRILSLFLTPLTPLVFLWIGMISAWGSLAVQGRATIAGQPAAVHPQGGFAVEVQAAPGANHFPLVVTETDGTVTTKYVDLLVENSIPVIHSYDLNGNLESVAPQATPGSPTRTYQWDAANRLVGITRILSPTETRKTEFLYNGAGARVGKKELLNGVVESDIKYFYGGTGVLQERSADGGTVLKTYTSQGEQSYLTINNQLSTINSQPSTSTINLYHTRDHLGSVREVVAEDGTLVARYDYKPYGKRVLASGSYESAKGYTGHDYLPAAGMILTRYRAYDPQTGRWLSPDPIEESGGLNLYGYVGEDPLNFTDPLGLDRWVSGGIGHTYIVANDKYSSTGFSQYEFGPAGGWFNLLHGPGEVFINEVTGPPPGWKSTKITSTVEQDQILRDTAIALRADPSSYNLVGSNCRHFTSTLKDAGMSAPNNPLIFIPFLSFPYSQPLRQSGTTVDVTKYMPPGGYPQGF